MEMEKTGKGKGRGRGAGGGEFTIVIAVLVVYLNEVSSFTLPSSMLGGSHSVLARQRRAQFTKSTGRTSVMSSIDTTGNPRTSGFFLKYGDTYSRARCCISSSTVTRIRALAAAGVTRAMQRPSTFLKALSDCCGSGPRNKTSGRTTSVAWTSRMTGAFTGCRDLSTT